VDSVFYTNVNSASFDISNKKAMDLQIINSVRNDLKFAIMRSSNCGFKYMNEKARALFGFSDTEEAKYLSRRMIFADADAYMHLQAKQKAYGTLRNERVLFSRVDQSNFWGSLTSAMYEMDGELVYDEIIEEVTAEVLQEHKLSEKSLLLEKVASELDRFVYSASHDLRSPISTMKGLLILMQKQLSGLSVDEFVNMMDESLDKLESHIDKLVEFSKNSNEPVSYESIELEKLMQSILYELDQHPNRKHIEIDYSIRGNYPFMCDMNKFKTLLFQTVKNSLDYMDPHKSKSFLSIKITRSQAKTTIEVIDNGIGIDKKHLPNIFQMFYRASTLSKGSGLGLYLVREAAIKLSGSVDINSDYGVGTCVIIQVPNAMNSLRNLHQLS
jgi:signal transduction histidine kinase